MGKNKLMNTLLDLGYSSAVATGTAFPVSSNPTDNYTFQLIADSTDPTGRVQIKGSINSSTGPFTQIGVDIATSTTEASTTAFQSVVTTPCRWIRADITTAGTTVNSTLVVLGFF